MHKRLREKVGMQSSETCLRYSLSLNSLIFFVISLFFYFLCVVPNLFYLKTELMVYCFRKQLQASSLTLLY